MAGFVKLSTSSGTLRTIRTAHKAAYKNHATPPCTNETFTFPYSVTGQDMSPNLIKSLVCRLI